MKWTLAAVAWTAILAFGLPWIPALGPLFDVRTGIWDYHPDGFESGTVRGLRKPVTVTFDKAGVPHVFAENSADLYLAQGYLSAAFRAFQLDLTTRAAAGRLSELVGSRGAEFDRFFVAMGFRKSNRERTEKYMRDSVTAEIMQSYVDGVNRRFEAMKSLPPEYKILDAKLDAYTPERIILMSKILTWNLAGRAFELALGEIQQKLGTEKVLDLFPEYNTIEDYVWTKSFPGEREPERPGRFDFETSLDFKKVPRFPLPNPKQGSNNFVVAPSKSVSGTSLFANDTHLGLSLPSVWMEIQLSSPEFNVYGVSLVGVPGIINGFNKDIAWGPTNGTTDVHDFFEIQFKDENSNLYLEDEKWVEARVEKEIIKGKNGSEEPIDVIYTNRGPVFYRQGNLGLASDWTGHISGQELLAIRRLFDAKNVDQCMDAFKDWLVPIQNFMCADPKNIGWVHAGFIPKRAVGYGRFIMDGRKNQPGLVEPIPEEFHPMTKNPPEGFIESANQKIVPPSFPYYMGWDYEPPFRGLTIRRELSKDKKFSAEDLRSLQNSYYDTEASILLPLLLKSIDTSGLSAKQKEYVEKLSKWDYNVLHTLVEPSLYKQWIVELRKVLFDDDYELHGERLLYPRDVRIAALLKNVMENPEHSDSQWVDDVRTKNKETLPFMVTVAFVDAFEDLDGWFSSIDDFTWQKWNAVHFSHIGRIPGFGSKILPMDGATESVRGVASGHGAVYKIVVETGDWPKAWISVPGGLNGDPFSADFERGVQEWAHAEMRPAEYYHDVNEARAAAVRVVELRPEGP
jgi:penicillin amidase